MVRPSGRRGDADLGPVTDMTGRVEGHLVTASSRGVRGRHNSSDIPVTPTLLHLVSIMVQGEADERGDDDGDGGDGDGGDGDGGDDDGDSGDDDHDDGDDDGDEEQPVYVALVAPASGSDGRSRNKRPNVVRDVPAPMQKRKKVKPSDWEQTETVEGGPVDPELIPSYDGYVAGRIWRGHVFIFMLK
ncbi:hypothetical protein M9H77_14621 [Catharanthus roseus]|uniref:Uncharacterized protein n=1 Tax=Catharanthus roseus TaxID=4058 RepID=A0ACC0BNM5_CATRO|nr:hypothetical protein M9H77_14621 [Catharanthus roseus]